MLFVDFQCFDCKVYYSSLFQLTKQFEEVSNKPELQVILLKLWDLGKYVRLNSKVNNEVPMHVKRSENKLNAHKLEYLTNKVDN